MWQRCSGSGPMGAPVGRFERMKMVAQSLNFSRSNEFFKTAIILYQCKNLLIISNPINIDLIGSELCLR